MFAVLPLPESIEVRISSEAAGYVSMTAVTRRNLRLIELIEPLIGITGKDVARVRDVLARGAMVAGDSRYRWRGFQLEDAELDSLLSSFPDPDPGRPFDASECTLAVIAGRRGHLEIDRASASERRWFRRRSFWQELMDVVSSEPPIYKDYSYSQRADVYEASLRPQSARRLEESASLLRYSVPERQLKGLGANRVQLFAPR